MEYNIEIKDGRQVPYATYKYCHTKLSARSGGGTGHLKRHAEACLKKIAAGRTQGRNIQTQFNFGADGSVSTWMYNPQVARDKIARYIVIEDLPIRTGESPSFERMIQRDFCPQYRHVSRRTTERDIIKLYQRKLSSSKENFLKVTFFFALTSDI